MRWTRRTTAVVAMIVGLSILASMALTKTSTNEHGSKHPHLDTDFARKSRGVYSPHSSAQSPSELMNELSKANVTRYYHLVGDVAANSDSAIRARNPAWDSLPTYATEAAKHDIQVVVYLVPPQETKSSLTYKPYGHDYLAWAKAISNLSLTHPAISGMAIDDLGRAIDSAPRHGKFSPAYAKEVRNSLKSRNEKLRLYGVLYGHDFGSRTLAFGRIRSGLDGVIYPFGGLGNFDSATHNTQNAAGVVFGASLVRNLSDCQDGPPCWNVELDNGDVSSSAARVTFSVPVAPGAHDVRFRMSHNLSSQDREALSVQVATDSGQATYVKEQDHSFRGRVQVPGEARSLTITLSLRTEVQGAIIQLSGLSIDDTGSVEPTSVSTIRSTNSRVEPAEKLEVILMTYAAKLGNERGVNGANPTYFREVMTQALQAERLGIVDGIVVYAPNSTGRRVNEFKADPENWTTLMKAFSS